MNILMVVKLFPPQYAGASVQGIYLSRELIRKGVKVDFLTNNFSDKSRVDIMEGMQIYRVSTYSESPRWYKLREAIYLLKTAWFILTHAQYDVIFVYSVVGFDAFLFPLCKFFKRRTILRLTLAENDDPLTLKKRKLGFLYFPSIACADKIVAISTRLFNMSLEAGVKREKLEYVPNGVDTSRFFLSDLSQRRSIKKKLGYENYDKIFLAVGQIEARKGYDFLVEAWRYIDAQIPSAILLIAGPLNNEKNPFYRQLVERIIELKLNNIKFLGLKDNVQDFLKITDCFLHGAVMEGLANVLLEAGFSGVPFVCRKIEGITSDIILNSNIGRECDSDSPKEFASHVMTLLKEHNEKQTRADIDLLQRKFDIKLVAAHYLEVFNKLHVNGKVP